MKIQKLSIIHLNNIQEIFNQQFIDDNWSKNQLVESFNNAAISFYGVFVEEELVTVAIILTTPDDINLLKIATKNSQKKRGFANSLLAFLISQKKPNQTFSLEVKATNLPAINLYQKFGLKTLHTRKKYYKDGTDALCMFLVNN